MGGVFTKIIPVSNSTIRCYRLDMWRNVMSPMLCGNTQPLMLPILACLWLTCRIRSLWLEECLLRQFLFQIAWLDAIDWICEEIWCPPCSVATQNHWQFKMLPILTCLWLTYIIRSLWWEECLLRQFLFQIARLDAIDWICEEIWCPPCSVATQNH